MNSAPNVSPDTESLVALVMELGSQLHIERARRVALEEALLAAGVLRREAIGAAGVTRRCANAPRSSSKTRLGSCCWCSPKIPDPARCHLRKQLALAGPFKPVLRTRAVTTLDRVRDSRSACHGQEHRDVAQLRPGSDVKLLSIR